MAAQNEQRGGKMGFMQHLGELRRRLMYCISVVFVLTLVTFNFAPELFDWLRTPLIHLPTAQKLIVLSPLELYVTYLKLAVLAAVFGAAPFVLYQLWAFIAPGLYGHERRWIAPFVTLGTLFFCAGVLFAFYLVLPLGFKFVAGSMPSTVEAQYSVAVYFEMVINMMLAFGLVFELPLIMWILSAAGIVDPKVYGKMRRYWIVVAFVVAAILTPPDPFTQCLMAAPLLVFYEMGALGAKILYRRRKPRTVTPPSTGAAQQA